MELKLQLDLFLFFQCFSMTSAAQIDASFSGIVTSTSANSVTITEVQVDDHFFAELFDGVSQEFIGSIVAESEEDFYLMVLRLELTEDGFQLTSVPARSSELS